MIDPGIPGASHSMPHHAATAEGCKPGDMGTEAVTANTPRIYTSCGSILHDSMQKT